MNNWHELIIKNGEYENEPPMGLPVMCLLRHCITGKEVEHVLKLVDEPDNNWRTADDNSPINYEWNVIKWRLK